MVNINFNIYKNKKVVVTGHTGFKGVWLVKTLELFGATVLGYSLEPYTTPSHYNLIKSTSKSVISDIRDLKSFENVCLEFEPDIIFHLAAQALVRESYNFSLDTFNTNIIGTCHIFEVAKSLKNLKAIINITTDKCYENQEWLWGYKESDPLGGYDPYSASKACSEIVSASYRNSFFNIVDYGKTHNVLIATARAGNVVGGGDWSKDRLIPDIIKSTIENKPVNIRTPNSTRPWQHVLDAINGYLMLGEKLLSNDSKFATSWNFGPLTLKEYSVKTVLKLAKISWDKIEVIFDDESSYIHEAQYLKLDSSKALKILKWEPKYSIEQTVENTIQWYKLYYEQDVLNTEAEIITFFGL